MIKKRIGMELHQQINKLIWKRMKRHSKENPEEKSRLEELLRVIEKIRNTETHQSKTKRTNKGPVKMRQ